MNAAFTIVSRNYLHFAKTLMQSLEQHAPEFERFVIICDERDEATCDEPADCVVAQQRDVAPASLLGHAFALIKPDLTSDT